MKTKHKSILKTLFLSAWAAIGTPTANGSVPFLMPFAKENTESKDEDAQSISEQLGNSVLTSSPSDMEVQGHGSHSSHGSHGSHGSHSSGSHASHASHSSSSHASHTSSSHASHASSTGGFEYDTFPSGSSTTAKNDKVTSIVAGSLLGAVTVTGIVLLIKHISKKHKKNRYYSYNYPGHGYKFDTQLEMLPYRNALYSCTYRNTDVDSVKSYLEVRNLSEDSVGRDVDELVNLLIDNSLFSAKDKSYSNNRINYKYNKKVSTSVKRLQKFLGMKQTGNATILFQKELKQWKRKRVYYRELLKSDSIDISKNNEAMIGLAAVLVQKGFLKNYNMEKIESSEESKKIIDAYYNFLNKYDYPKTTVINSEIINKLYSLPTL